MKNTIISHKNYVGRRFLAGLIDYLIIFYGTLYFIEIFGQPNDEGGHSVTGSLALAPMFFWLFMTVGFEQFFGSTLGNGIVRLKPIQESGSHYKITIGQSLKRHLLDIVDMAFFGLVAYFTIKNTEKKQRIGDLWAKTIVVKIEE